MNRTHSFSEKLNVVSLAKNGESLSSLSIKYNLDRKMLREWLRKYDLYGEGGLQKQPYVVFSAPLKEEIVKIALEKSISLPLICLKYAVSISSLKSWIKIVKTKGYAGLYLERKPNGSSKAMGRPKKRIPATELEKLQAENARLRAENALLKKVKALVEEREARERMSGQKPSKN